MAGPGARLYIGNMPYVAQKNEVEDILATKGIQYSNIDFSTDPFTGRNPSYCFVDLDTAEDVEDAIGKLEGQKIRGRLLKVNYNTEKRLPNRTPRHYSDRWANDRPADMADEKAFVFNRWERKDAPDHWVDPLLQSRRVMVDGLARISQQHEQQLEMRSLLQGYNVEAVSKLIVRTDKLGNSAGLQHYCFVDLATPEEASRAAKELDGKRNSGGRAIRVRVAPNRNIPVTKVEREQYGFTKPQQRWTETPRRDLNASSWRRSDQSCNPPS